mgnify:FL=1
MRAGWESPGKIHFVPVDFTKDNLTQRLLETGFDRTKQSFFSWLGVAYYLPMAAIDWTLSELSALCAEGSALVFDYPDEGFFAASERRVQNTIRMAQAGGEAMQSSFSEPQLEKLLERHGFLIYELLTPAEIQRTVIDPAGADISAFEHVRHCLAVRKL